MTERRRFSPNPPPFPRRQLICGRSLRNIFILIKKQNSNSPTRIICFNIDCLSGLSDSPWVTVFILFLHIESHHIESQDFAKNHGSCLELAGAVPSGLGVNLTFSINQFGTYFACDLGQYFFICLWLPSTKICLNLVMWLVSRLM